MKAVKERLYESLRQRVTYLGSTTINAPRSESEIQRNMAVLNDTSPAMEITLIVPKTPEECVQMFEICDTSDRVTTGTGDEL